MLMADLFHRKTLARLGIQHMSDPKAKRMLEARAANLGISLPKAFLEWYGMHRGIDLLREHSNQDWPVDIERLGTQFGLEWIHERDWLREGKLVLMVENQTVCGWALQLDGSDDPPVVVAVDHDLEWRPCADSLSMYIGCQVWDHTEIWDRTNRTAPAKPSLHCVARRVAKPRGLAGQRHPRYIPLTNR
jgi:hypothetical protein